MATAAGGKVKVEAKAKMEELVGNVDGFADSGSVVSPLHHVRMLTRRTVSPAQSVNDTWSTSSPIPSRQLLLSNESPLISSPSSPDQDSAIPSPFRRRSSLSPPLPIRNWRSEPTRCSRFCIRSTLRSWLRDSSRRSKCAMAMRKLLLECICFKVGLSFRSVKCALIFRQVIRSILPFPSSVVGTSGYFSVSFHIVSLTSIRSTAFTKKNERTNSTSSSHSRGPSSSNPDRHAPTSVLDIMPHTPADSP